MEFKHALNSMIFMDKLWIPQISWTQCSASSAVNFQLFYGIQKSFYAKKNKNNKNNNNNNKASLKTFEQSSRSRKVDFEILRISLWNEKLTNLNAKSAKRSLKMWATNFKKSFFKNIVFSNGRQSNIRSVHTYGVS